MTDKKEALRVLSIGAGAIGTYIGGSLALKGQHVVFLEQPQVAKQLKAGSLRLNLHGEEHEISAPQIAASMEEALAMGPYDLALFALKSYDTIPALEGLAAHAKDLPPFLCLQNGVDNEAAIAKVLGEDKVIYATVTSAVGRRGAGDILLERLRGIGVAEGPATSLRLAAALREAGLNPELYRDARAMKWSKMLTNLLANASSAILDMTPGEIFEHKQLYRLEVAQLREALAVMKAQNIPVVNLPGTLVKALAFSIRSLPFFVSQPLLSQKVGKGRGEKMPSFHIDLHSGRGKSEVNYLNGAVVRAGEQHGIPTPVNKLLNDTLAGLTRGELAIEDYRHKPEMLLGA